MILGGLMSARFYMNVKEHYLKSLAQKGYEADASQKQAVERLQTLSNELSNYTLNSKESKGFLSGLFGGSKTEVVAPRGVYMWGGVGRGKSFVMDSFYASVAYEKKTRIHFHEFMRSIHNRLREISQQSDPLDIIATQISEKFSLICFDEFHISDIADAMILYRLLSKFFEKGVVFVMTSNYAPDTLYPDGLHRDRLLPAIDLIKKKMDVINVDVGVDYRLRELEQLKTYYTPIDAQTEGELRHCFETVCNGLISGDSIEIQSRELDVVARSDDTLWVTFSEMCIKPRSQIDYLEIANKFKNIILSDIPKMSPQDASAARRFTWLIDVLYDHKVNLIISAEVPAEELFTEGVFAQEFTRTVSRMIEMRSLEYKNEKARKSVTV